MEGAAAELFCLFSLRWFLTSFYTNPGCLVPIQVPAGEEQREGVGQGVDMCPRWLGGSASWELGGLSLFSGLAPLPSLGCFSSPAGALAVQVSPCWFCTD